MNKMTTLALAAVCAFSATGCGMHKIFTGLGGPAIVGSGKTATESRTVPAFRKVELQGSIDVEVTVGSAGPLKVEADDNLVKMITTEVRGDTLVVSTKGGSYSSKTSMKVVCSTASFDAGSINGSGNMLVRDVHGKDVSFDISGSGSIAASGSTDTLKGDIQGSGDLHLDRLTARTAKVGISGSGGADVNVSDDLNVDIAGSGDVRYQGKPQVHKSISGSGGVHPR